jgi:peptidoglycan/xylan/chitin deacetylase (PgdA/CDA1 family)
MRTEPATASPSIPRPSAVRQLARAAMSRVLPRRLFMTAGPATSRAVALTFDDGPHPEHTSAVLDRLAAHGVRATFFVVGARAEAHPALVARIVAEGHALGHHSWSHGRAEETAPAALVAEARRTEALLARLTGRRPRLFRPPFGAVGVAKLVGLWRAGQAVALWNQDPKDFAQGDLAPIRRWVADAPLAGGDIVLLHDVFAHAAPAVDAVVDRVRALGLGFATLEEWLDG